jgi:hypothetical protein
LAFAGENPLAPASRPKQAGGGVESCHVVAEVILPRNWPAGVTVGEIREHFGPSFYKWSKEKDNRKSFDIKTDGNKTIWRVKKS